MRAQGRAMSIVVVALCATSAGVQAQDCAEQRLRSPNGPGVMVRRDCTRFEGTFRDGLLQGKGKLTSRDRVEEGDFSRGRLWGTGKITWKDGRVAEGDFVDGRLSGQGRIVHNAAGDQWHEGVFYRGYPQGPGRKRDQRGEIHEGMFDSSGNLDGRGIRTYPDGSKLYSQFREGTPVGQAIFVKPDGTEERRTYRMNGWLEATPAAPTPAAATPASSTPASSTPPTTPASAPTSTSAGASQPPAEKPAAPPASGGAAPTQVIQEVDRAIRGLRGIFGR